MFNIFLRAPVWMQLAHLLPANLAWIALVLFTAAALDKYVTTGHAVTVADAPAG